MENWKIVTLGLVHSLSSTRINCLITFCAIALSCLYWLEVRAMSSAALQYVKGQIVYRSLFFSALNKVIFVVTCNDVIYIITPFSRQESSAADSVLIFGKSL